MIRLSNRGRIVTRPGRAGVRFAAAVHVDVQIAGPLQPLDDAGVQPLTDNIAQGRPWQRATVVAHGRSVEPYSTIILSPTRRLGPDGSSSGTRFLSTWGCARWTTDSVSIWTWPRCAMAWWVPSTPVPNPASAPSPRYAAPAASGG